MDSKEPVCALNIRRFPKELRNRLNKIAVDLEEDVQDFVPRWLRERAEQEERKIAEQGKKSAKQK
jgi:hypothetical protein